MTDKDASDSIDHMARIVKNRSKKAGLPPGTLIHIGERVTEEPLIRAMRYSEDKFEELLVNDPEECARFLQEGSVTWISVIGIDRAEIIEKIGEAFHLHPLLLEDIMNTDQRPKLEAYDDYVFITLRTLHFDKTVKTVDTDQVSFVLGRNYVISFQESDLGIFDTVVNRLNNGGKRMRKQEGDYLVYSLIDVIIDNYFVVLEAIGENIDKLEEKLVISPKTATLKTIQGLKREMIVLRRSVWPLREVVSAMERDESAFIHNSTRIYLRDLYDHTVQSIDTIETYRDMLSGILDIYLSSVSNRLNEVMKVLAVIATIFMPLTFIAGVYGMNFHYMPELEWFLGYPAALAVMAVTAAIMVFYFKKKKWF